MDPEELNSAAGLDPAGGADGMSEAEVLGSDGAGETAEPGSGEGAVENAAALRAWLDTDEGRAEINRRARSFKGTLVDDFRRAKQGDADALKALQNDRQGKRLWGEYLDGLSQRDRNWTVGNARYQELTVLRDSDPDAFNAEVSRHDGEWDWYHKVAPQFFGPNARTQAPIPERSAPRPGGDPIDDAYATLTLDPRWGTLSPADQDAIEEAASQDNAYAAVAAMNRVFGERVTAANGAGRRTTVAVQTAPPSPRAGERANLPPPQTGRPARQRTDESVLDAFLADPQGASQADVMAVLKRSGWSPG